VSNAFQPTKFSSHREVRHLFRSKVCDMICRMEYTCRYSTAICPHVVTLYVSFSSDPLDYLFICTVCLSFCLTFCLSVCLSRLYPDNRLNVSFCHYLPDVVIHCHDNPCDNLVKQVESLFLFGIDDDTLSVVQNPCSTLGHCD